MEGRLGRMLVGPSGVASDSARDVYPSRLWTVVSDRWFADAGVCEEVAAGKSSAWVWLCGILDAVWVP